MDIVPRQIIVNADDLGLKSSVNKAILYCFEQGYINSTSLLTNMDCFKETVEFIHAQPAIKNIGLHINLAEGKPVSNFTANEYLDDLGNWDIKKTGKSLNKLNATTRDQFSTEIITQIEKALTAGINIVHIDSHLHLHTLPAFYSLFIEIAQQYKLKLRLAQTYREGNYLKFYYRKYINEKMKRANINYSDLFETVDVFLNKKDIALADKAIEIMVHPDFDITGKLFDHVDRTSMDKWISYLRN